MSALVEHADFCLPRPGFDEPRIERYVQTVDSEDPTRLPRHVLTVRCQECAAASYTEA